MPMINVKVTPVNPNIQVAIFPSGKQSRPLAKANTAEGHDALVEDNKFHTATMQLARGNVGDEYTLTITGKNDTTVEEPATVQASKTMWTFADFLIQGGEVS